MLATEHGLDYCWSDLADCLTEKDLRGVIADLIRFGKQTFPNFTAPNSNSLQAICQTCREIVEAYPDENYNFWCPKCKGIVGWTWAERVQEEGNG